MEPKPHARRAGPSGRVSRAASDRRAPEPRGVWAMWRASARDWDSAERSVRARADALAANWGDAAQLSLDEIAAGEGWSEC